MNNKKKKPLYQVIVEDLKNRIQAGEFEPTQPFPSQRELTHMYNTSEITIRRALTELANEGILDRTQKKGTYLKLNDHNQIVRINRPNSLNKILFVYQSRRCICKQGPIS